MEGMVSDLWLTPEEVGELTELLPSSWRAQCRRLARMGVPFRPNAAGRPLVERAAVCDAPKPSPKAKRREPNWEAMRRGKAA
jgi:hypothetical protein